MPTDVLVDTSAWILALRRKPVQAARKRIDALLEADAVAVAPPIKLELLGGTRTQGEYERLKERLDALRQIEIAPRTWDIAARLAFDLRRQGVTVPYMDLIIAATAIAKGMVVLHADSDFDTIAELSDLKVESFAHKV